MNSGIGLVVFAGGGVLGRDENHTGNVKQLADFSHFCLVLKQKKKAVFCLPFSIMTNNAVVLVEITRPKTNR